MTWLLSDIPTSIAVEDFVVRKYEIEDALALVNAVTQSLPELLPWMPWAKFEPQSVQQREELIRQWWREWDEKSNFTMGIFRGNECIGGTGLHLRGDVGELEIGYWVSSQHTGHGIATTVSAVLINLAFSFPEVNKVDIAHDIANTKSERIPRVLGLQVVREYEREPLAPKESGHVRVWCLTRDEWSKR
jgi:RimJ/RimL family protein N-acetyltransferase